jgi:hypothetical protein
MTYEEKEAEDRDEEKEAEDRDEEKEAELDGNKGYWRY